MPLPPPPLRAVEKEKRRECKLHLLLGRVLVLEQIGAQVVIPSGKQAHDTSPSTNNLPRQLPRSIFSISTKAQPSTQRNNRNRIPNKYRVIAIPLRIPSNLLRLLLSFLALLLSLFLFSSPSSCVFALPSPRLSHPHDASASCHYPQPHC